MMPLPPTIAHFSVVLTPPNYLVRHLCLPEEMQSPGPSTWCFCRRFLSCSIFCCFSSFSVMRASLRVWRLLRLYALELRAVSRVVSRRMQATTSCLSCQEGSSQRASPNGVQAPEPYSSLVSIQWSRMGDSVSFSATVGLLVNEETKSYQMYVVFSKTV